MLLFERNVPKWLGGGLGDDVDDDAGEAILGDKAANNILSKAQTDPLMFEAEV